MNKVNNQNKKSDQNFWSKLHQESLKSGRPLCVLAPMADVTDAAFRRIIAAHGKPDVMWTEFVSADGLMSAGRERLLKDLMYTPAERPIVAQLFTSKPEKMKGAAELARELGFDGIDINMGCPDRSIEKQGAGAALIKNPKLAREVIAAAQAGAGGLPVSVKTRIGYNKNELETWLPELLAENPAVVTIHARTRKEMSLVPARWEEVKRAVEIRDTLQGKDNPEKTLIFGNGDALDLKDAEEKARRSGADGAMLGRAIFGNPWLFSRERNREDVPVKERLETLAEHAKLFEELLGNSKNFAIMKKHFKAYVNGWDGAKELRMELMGAEHAADVARIISEYISHHTVDSA